MNICTRDTMLLFSFVERTKNSPKLISSLEGKSEDSLSNCQIEEHVEGKNTKNKMTYADAVKASDNKIQHYRIGEQCS